MMWLRAPALECDGSRLECERRHLLAVLVILSSPHGFFICQVGIMSI